MNVLVTGGAGYIGSVVTEALLAVGHSVTVFDNLSTGHRDAVPDAARFVAGDLRDVAAVTDALAASRADAVVHMAALSLVGESVREPARYHDHNVGGARALLDAMDRCGVERVVFSSSASVYASDAPQPLDEGAAIAPANPYGENKRDVERMLAAHPRLRHVSLRYFNAAGASDHRGERHDPETHLIPRVLMAVAGTAPAVSIFGDDYATDDGTCVRDYVHVLDLADAHLRALDALASGADVPPALNVGGGGRGSSVREVIAAVERVTRRRVAVEVAPRRAGDPPMLVASIDRIRATLGWTPRQSALDAMVESAWRWMQRTEHAR